MNVHAIGASFNLSYDNPKYNNYLKNNFALTLEFLINGAWIPKTIPFRTIESIDGSFYISSESNIEAVRIGGLFYNNQPIPAADWGMDNFYVHLKNSINSEISQTYDWTNGLSDITDAIKKNKFEIIWVNSIPGSLPPVLLFDFFIQMRDTYKTFVFRSPAIDPSAIEVRIDKVVRENGSSGRFKLKPPDDHPDNRPDAYPEYVQSIKNLDIDQLETKYINTVTISASDPAKNEWYAYFRLQDDIDNSDVIIARLIHGKEFNVKDEYKILYPHHVKAYFYINAMYKDSKVYLYDGRMHSMVNPLTNSFYGRGYILGLVLKGFGVFPFSVDIDVYTSLRKYVTNTDDFIREMTEETFNTFEFIRVSENWKALFKYETAIVKGSDTFLINCIDFHEGNFFIPLVPTEWLMVKNISFADEQGGFIRDKEIRVFNEKGSPFIHTNLNNLTYISFVIRTTTPLTYLFSINGAKKEHRVIDSELTALSSNDIYLADMLIREGYENLYLPPKYRALNMYGANPNSFELAKAPNYIEDEALTGWWGTVRKEALMTALWYDAHYSEYRDLEGVSQNLASTATEALLPDFFEIEVRHVFDNSLVLNSVVNFKTIEQDVTNNNFFTIRDSETGLQTQNKKAQRLLTYGSTGKIVIPQAYADSILVSIDPAWAALRGFKIRKGSAILNRYSPKVTLYVSNVSNEQKTGLGSDYMTDTMLFLTESVFNGRVIEVRDAYTGDLVEGAVITTGGVDLTLWDGFINSSNILINNATEVRLSENWLNLKGLIDLMPEPFNSFDKNTFFTNEKCFLTNREPDQFYRKTIYWVYERPINYWQRDTRPSSFRLIISLCAFQTVSAAHSYTPYRYQASRNDLNITVFLNSIPLLRDNMQNVRFSLMSNEYAIGLCAAMVSEVSASFSHIVMKEDFITTTLRLRGLFSTYMSSNIIKRERPVVEAPITFRLNPDMPLFQLIDLSEGPIERSVAAALNGNPDDINLNFYDRMEFNQISLTSFVITSNAAISRPLYGRVFRKLSFSGEIRIYDEPLRITGGYMEKVMPAGQIRSEIYSSHNIMPLNERYDRCFNLEVSSDIVMIKFPESSNYSRTGETIYADSLMRFLYLVQFGETVENDRAYFITDVLFKTTGNKRLDQNYLKPLFFTKIDGSDTVHGFTTEKMVFKTTENISGYVNRPESPKLFLSGLSNIFTLKSRLFGNPYEGHDGFKWSVRNIKNEFNDPYYEAYVDFDNLMVSTEISISMYSGTFKIPVTLENNKGNRPGHGLILEAGALRNYKPRDIFGNVYLPDDYENIVFTIINEDGSVRFHWGNTESNNNSGLNDVLFEMLNPQDVLYTTNRNFSGFIPEDRAFRIFEIDWELLRPRSKDNVLYDLSRSLEHINFKIINHEDFWLVIWIDNKKPEREGSISILITKEASFIDEIIRLLMRPRQMVTFNLKETILIGSIELRDEIADDIIRLLLKARHLVKFGLTEILTIGSLDLRDQITEIIRLLLKARHQVRFKAHEIITLGAIELREEIADEILRILLKARHLVRFKTHEIITIGSLELREEMSDEIIRLLLKARHLVKFGLTEIISIGSLELRDDISEIIRLLLKARHLIRLNTHEIITIGSLELRDDVSEIIRLLLKARHLIRFNTHEIITIGGLELRDQVSEILRLLLKARHRVRWGTHEIITVGRIDLEETETENIIRLFLKAKHKIDFHAQETLTIGSISILEFIADCIVNLVMVSNQNVSLKTQEKIKAGHVDLTGTVENIINKLLKPKQKINFEASENITLGGI